MQTQSRNLHALRGVACLMVVLVHLWVLESQFGKQTAVFKEIRWFGFAGVDLFFVLSGFLITATNVRHLGRPGAVPGYLFRRFWRVYPTYWVVFAASFLVVWALGGVSPEVGRSWRWWALLVPCGDDNRIVGQAWTLSYEVMFYLAFGALLVLPPRLAGLALCGWAGWVAWALGRPEPLSPLGKLPVSPFVLEFLGGALVAWLTTARGVRRWGGPALLLGIGWAVVGVALAAGESPGEGYLVAMSGQRLRALVFGPAAVLVVYAAVAAEGRWRVPRFLLRAGDASYSLYLVHPMAYLLAKSVGVRVPHTNVSHLLWLCGSFAGAVAIGFAVHELVERPLLNLGRRKRAAAPAIPVAPALAA